MISSELILKYYDYSYLPGPVIMILNRILSLFSYKFMQSPVSVILSVLTLISFQKIRLKPNKYVYLVSGATFGVYLIHDSSWIRDYIWNTLFNVASMADSKYFILFMFGVCTLILVVGTVIDVLRKLLIEKPLFNSRIYNITEKYLSEKFNSFFDKLNVR